MWIMPDTNVLVSLLLFPDERINAMLALIFSEHELILSSFVVTELKDVIRRKFPAQAGVIDRFLLKMSYTLVYTPDEIDPCWFYGKISLIESTIPNCPLVILNYRLSRVFESRFLSAHPSPPRASG
ncbi:MAG: type II toxin-antitoxin system VapC family toxin [Synergistaceae bacterium]|nr:type II toxin-antitoxin system VapC family toxin [Synergistaceae bacterium]